jgi:MFS family permease
MTLATFQAFWGKAYKYFPLKIIFMTCIVIFEIGSLIVALAPSSLAVIVGRAVQGAGGAGVTGGCYIIAAFITRPKNMAKIIGLFSTAWACASILGPILGGVFTQNISWRWCFWVNLPIGGVTMVIILLLFKTPAHSRLAGATWKELPFRFDVGGVVLLLAALTCLLLALEMGGATKPWNNSVPIGLLVGFSLIIVVLVVLEWKQGEISMVVFRVAKHRTVAAFCVFGFCVHSGCFARNYNLPIYFQAVQGVSPSESGIRTLPTVLTGCEFYPPSPLIIHHHLSTQYTEHLPKQHFSALWALSSWVKLVTGSCSSALGVSSLWSAQA